MKGAIVKNIILSTALSVCLAPFIARALPGPTSATFDKGALFTVAGYTGASTLSGFPVLVPNEPYVLVVDYPDEAPRSVTVFNFGNATRHGYHTGWTAGKIGRCVAQTRIRRTPPLRHGGGRRQVRRGPHARNH